MTITVWHVSLCASKVLFLSPELPKEITLKTTQFPSCHKILTAFNQPELFSSVGAKICQELTIRQSLTQDMLIVESKRFEQLVHQHSLSLAMPMEGPSICLSIVV